LSLTTSTLALSPRQSLFLPFFFFQAEDGIRDIELVSPPRQLHTPRLVPEDRRRRHSRRFDRVSFQLTVTCEQLISGMFTFTSGALVVTVPVDEYAVTHGVEYVRYG